MRIICWFYCQINTSQPQSFLCNYQDFSPQAWLMHTGSSTEPPNYNIPTGDLSFLSALNLEITMFQDLKLCRFVDRSNPLFQSSGYESEVFCSLEMQAAGNREMMLPATKYMVLCYRKLHIFIPFTVFYLYFHMQCQLTNIHSPQIEGTI